MPRFVDDRRFNWRLVDRGVRYWGSVAPLDESFLDHPCEEDVLFVCPASPRWHHLALQVFLTYAPEGFAGVVVRAQQLLLEADRLANSFKAF